MNNNFDDNINNNINNNISNNYINQMNSQMDNHINNDYFTEYLNSVSQSRRLLSLMTETLYRQESNLYNIYNTEFLRNNQRQRNSFRYSPVSRWWRSQAQPPQPNFPSRTNRFNYDALRGLFNLNNLDPVVVRPTREQVLNSTTVISLREIPVSNRFYNVCPISYETFTDDTVVTRINHCGHYFDTNSINQWFNMNVRCPVCRYDIRNDISRENNNNAVDLSGNSSSIRDTVPTTRSTTSSTTASTSASTTASTTASTSASTSANASTNMPGYSSRTQNTTTTNISPVYNSNNIANTDINPDFSVLDSLFSNLQHYVSNSPSVLHLEYRFVPIDISNNVTETESDAE